MSLNEGMSSSQYHYAQMFKHALALYNACRAKTMDSDRVVLLNCVWEPPDSYELSDETKEWIDLSKDVEHREFNAFLDAMEPVRRLLLDDCDVRFDIRYMTAGELIERVDHPQKERRLLERYL